MTVSSSFAGAYHYTFKRKRSIEATGISLPSRTPPGRPGHPLEALSDFQAPPYPASMSASDQMRAMLDQLMGTSRNGE